MADKLDMALDDLIKAGKKPSRGRPQKRPSAPPHKNRPSRSAKNIVRPFRRHDNRPAITKAPPSRRPIKKLENFEISIVNDKLREPPPAATSYRSGAAMDIYPQQRASMERYRAPPMVHGLYSGMGGAQPSTSHQVYSDSQIKKP